MLEHGLIICRADSMNLLSAFQIVAHIPVIIRIVPAKKEFIIGEKQSINKETIIQSWTIPAKIQVIFAVLRLRITQEF
jgi:hypothetical protein